MSAIPRHRHHALESAPRQGGVLRIDRDLENVVAEGTLDGLERDHLHVGTVQAAADAAVGGDELPARETLLALVDEGPLGPAAAAAGPGVAPHGGTHSGGG